MKPDVKDNQKPSTYVDQELEEYRSLLEPPDKYEEGFNIKTVLGALFIGFVMMPGSIYLGLVAGQNLGPAAEWVTIILFTEIARRSLTTLRKQEIYVLFYIASTLMATMGGIALPGSPFSSWIWNAYLRTSVAMKGFGIDTDIPNWAVPPANSPALLHRSLFHHDWLIPFLLLMVGIVLGKMNSYGLGYALFRMTSDVEKLPFPMAPVSTQGIIALAEASSKEESWRWRVFSMGSMIGLVFGAFYVGIPTLSGALLSKPLQLIPIPFIDLTHSTQNFMPASPTGIATDLGAVLWGMVLPFYAVVGGFIAAMATLILNPVLFHKGILKHWQPGMDTIRTVTTNQMDFYFSLGIGVALAVALIGIVSVTRGALEARKNLTLRGSWEPPEGRGDFPIWLALSLFVLSTFGYLALCHVLVPRFSLLFLLLFAFVFTPVNSYVNARMQGLTGQWVEIPFVLQGTLVLSKYKGVDIWFAPLPLHNYGGMAQHFRVVELTGTRITSIIKADLLVLPIMIVCSFIFWQFFWRLAPIPSQAYPYAQKMWHLAAFNQGLWMTATSDENSYFLKAINKDIILGGLAFGLCGYAILSWFKLPILLIYGFIRGLGSLPHGFIPEMFGALLARYYFWPKYGKKQWRLYATVLVAGYACGMGLVGMACAAIAMISKAVSQLPY